VGMARGCRGRSATNRDLYCVEGYGVRGLSKFAAAEWRERVAVAVPGFVADKPAMLSLPASRLLPAQPVPARRLAGRRVPVRRQVGRGPNVDGEGWNVTRELHVSGGAVSATMSRVPPRSVCDLRVSACPAVAGRRLHRR
jgi:hypothetical protein